MRIALGRPRFYNEAKERIDQPGISTGMVWTPVGGDIVFIEATAVAGNRELKITGQLGEVMRESAEAALTYVRSRSKALGIEPEFFDTHAVHIHVPAGARPRTARRRASPWQRPWPRRRPGGWCATTWR